MNQVFSDYLRHFVLVFFDDILVYSPTMESHCNQLMEVLCLLREHKLYVKLSKCEFAKIRLEYLGHTISSEGVEAN